MALTLKACKAPGMTHHYLPTFGIRKLCWAGLGLSTLPCSLFVQG